MEYIEIRKIKDLINIEDDLNAKYILVNDLDLKGVKFKPIGLDSIDRNKWTDKQDIKVGFRGILDGNGYKINNLNIILEDNQWAAYAGLFAYLNGSTIKNLKVLGEIKAKKNYVGGLAGAISNNTNINNCCFLGSVKGGYHTGAFAGINTENSNINNCYAKGKVEGLDRTGGFVGLNNYNSIISNCYCFVSVIGNDYTGGFVGYNRNSTIKYCYSNGSVRGDENVGGFCGYNDKDSTLSNSYIIKKQKQDINGIKNIGGFIGYDGKEKRSIINNAKNELDKNLNKLPDGFKNDIWVKENNEFPELTYFKENNTLKIEDIFVKDSDNNIENFENEIKNLNNHIEDLELRIQELEEKDYKHIKNAYDFLNINDDLDGKYILDNDIYLDNDFKPIALGSEFRGILKGKGYKISLNININNDNIGLFSVINKATIKNLKINGSVTGNNNIGGLAGKIIDSKIINVSFKGLIKGQSKAGGLTAQSIKSYIEDSKFLGSIYNEEKTGGLVASCKKSIIKSCYCYAFLKAQGKYCGGLVAYNSNSNIINSYFYGNILNTDECTGGIVGINKDNSNIENCYTFNYIDSFSYSGGFAGCNYAFIKNSYAVTYVVKHDKQEAIGDFIGYNEGKKVLNCYVSYIEIENKYNVNGFIGKNEEGNTIAIVDENTIDKKADDLPKNFDNKTWIKENNYYPILKDINNIKQKKKQIDGIIKYNIIKDTNDFKNIKNNLNSNYILINDLDFNNEAIKSLDQEYAFCGVLNGNNHTIKNLNIKGQALFNELDSAKILNLNIENAFLESENDCAILALKADNSEIKNCKIQANLKGKNNIGGLVSEIKNTILLNNSFRGTIKGCNNIGGLVALSLEKSKIINCYSILKIKGSNNIGGLIAFNKSPLKNCFSKVEIFALDEVGGLISINKAKIKNCYSLSKIKANKNIGGFIGNNKDLILNCYAKTHIEGKENLGAFLGFNSKNVNIENSFGLANDINIFIGYDENKTEYINLENKELDEKNMENFNCIEWHKEKGFFPVLKSIDLILQKDLQKDLQNGLTY